MSKNFYRNTLIAFICFWAICMFQVTRLQESYEVLSQSNIELERERKSLKDGNESLLYRIEEKDRVIVELKNSIPK